MNLLITICGRAGSKGLLNKNLRDFLGKPLISYTIASAFLFRDRRMEDQVDVCVSSDGDSLLDLAEHFGVTGVKRPDELAGDDSPKVPAIRHAAEYMEVRFGRRYDFVIDLDITSPLRKTVDIENALVKSIKNEGMDVVFSVVPSRRNPYFNMVEDRGGNLKKVIDAYFPSRQSAPKVYDMNASIYCYRRESLFDRLPCSPLDGNFDIILMKDTAVLDIDSEEDFRLLELLAGYFYKDEFQEIFDNTYPKIL